MEKFFECVIPIRPVPKGRPRATFQHGRVIVYTPADSRKYAEYAKWVMLAEFVQTGLVMVPRIMPVEVEFTFGLQSPPQAKPDLFNLEMQLADALTGIIIEDDCQVTGCYSHKIPAEEEFTRVVVRV